MKEIAHLYEPWNLSATSCVVIPVTINKVGAVKISAKLPQEATHLKGILISAKIPAGRKVGGKIYLSFDNGAIKPYIGMVYSNEFIADGSWPFVLNEPLRKNNRMEGFYYDDVFATAFELKIYIHYTSEYEPPNCHTTCRATHA